METILLLCRHSRSKRGKSYNVLLWPQDGNETRRMLSDKMEQTICLISLCYIMHRYSKLLHFTFKLLTWRVISLTAFRPTGLYPIAMIDISECRQLEPMRCSRWSPVVAKTNQGEINLEFSYQGDHLPDTSLMHSPFNHSSFP